MSDPLLRVEKVEVVYKRVITAVQGVGTQLSTNFNTISSSLK